MGEDSGWTWGGYADCRRGEGSGFFVESSDTGGGTIRGTSFAGGVPGVVGR